MKSVNTPASRMSPKLIRRFAVSRDCRAKRPPAPIRTVVASAIRNVAMCGIADDLPVNVGAAAAERVERGGHLARRDTAAS